MGASLMHLGEYLVQAGKRRHEIGVWDCCIYPADWLVINGHPDPMAAWRGTYASEDAADPRGGLEEAFAEGMALTGLHLTAVPGPGDVGLIDLLGVKAGAIWTGRRWSFVAPRGLSFSPLDERCVLAIWSLDCG